MNTKNTSLLRQHLPWHLSRFKTLLFLLNGLILSSHVTLSRIAACCGYGPYVKNESLQKRFSRFLKEVPIEALVWAKLLLALLKIPRRAPLELLIDRTNWQRGQHSLNFLVVALRWNKTALPLYVQAIFEQDGGNSTYAQVQEILQLVLQTFGKKRIKMIVGDREFGSFKRIKLYQHLGIPFVVRLKEQWHYAKPKREQGPVLLHTLFEDLKVGQSRRIDNLSLGQHQKQEVFCSVSAKRITEKEVLIVAHSPCLQQPLSAYKRRWRIERCFLECKTQGFHLESTGIMDEQRLQSLIRVIALARSMILGQAFKETQDKPIVIKKHGYGALSLFKLGFQLLRARSPAYLLASLQIVR